MENPLRNFVESAKDLSRNPLGIIALFIVLVYGFACLLFGLSAKNLTPDERAPLIWFTVVFPVLVLILFAWLVAKHHDKLYGPQDYRSDESFLKTLQERHERVSVRTKDSEKNIDDLMQYGADFQIVKEQEGRIRKDLESRNLDYTGPATKVLIRHLAVSQVLIVFEKIYSLIFGSQIRLLKAINESAVGLSTDTIMPYFNQIKSLYPKELGAWSVDNYLRFLYDSGLIQKTDIAIIITPIGREFLTWLDKSGYSKTKML